MLLFTQDFASAFRAFGPLLCKVCSTAIVSLELDKPCIVGTVLVSGTKATDALKEGVAVVVEGYSGVTEAVNTQGKPHQRRYGTVYQYLPDDPTVPEVVESVPHIPPSM